MTFGFRFKIILFSCILVLATNAVTAYLFHVETEESNYRASKAHIPKEISKIVSGIKTEIGSFYSDFLRLAHINFFPDAPIYFSNTKNNQISIMQKQMMVSGFTETLTRHRSIISLGLIDMRNLGQEVLRIERLSNGQITETPTSQLHSYLKSKLFGDAVNLQPGQALVSFEEINKDNESNILYFSTPILNTNQNAEAVLIASLDLNILTDALFEDNLKDILLLTNNQNAVIHKSTQLEASKIEQAMQSLYNNSFEKVLNSKTDTSKNHIHIIELDNHSYFNNQAKGFIWSDQTISLRHLTVPELADQLKNIKVVLMHPYYSSTLDFNNFPYIWAITIAAIMLFTYLLSLAFSISLTSPLNKIIEATKLFAEQGYIFEGRLPLKAKDETGVIAKAFVGLFDRVESNYLHLDDTIRELVASQTKQIHSNTALKRRIEKLNKDHLIKNELLSKVSKEIRAPLIGLIGSLQLLEDHISSREDLRLIRDGKISTNHLLKLLNDLIDASSLDSNEVQILQSPFSLSDLLSDIPPTIESLREEKNASFVINSLEDFQATLIGDAYRLQKILINILALSFNQCKPNATISLSLKVIDEGDEHINIKFTIKDNSGGDTPSKIVQLQSLLDQEDKITNNIPCEDIFSLINAERILQLMDSKLTVEIIPHLGYSFFFNIELAKSASFSEDNVATDYLKGLSALIVENVPVNRNVLTKLLKNLGVVVTTAVDGMEAVNLCDDMSFDIIYMDIQMPVLDGESAAKIIRNNSNRNHSSVIIAVTDHEDREHQELYENIMDGCIIKPLKKNQLIKETYLAFKKSGQLL